MFRKDADKGQRHGVQALMLDIAAAI